MLITNEGIPLQTTVDNDTTVQVNETLSQNIHYCFPENNLTFIYSMEVWSLSYPTKPELWSRKWTGRMI